MRNGELLEMIWRGDIVSSDSDAARRMARVLGTLVPLPIICLSARTGVDRSLLLLEETELMPGLPLGDVLAEELGIDVPYGAMVVIGGADLAAGRAADGDLSHAAGLLVGEALLDAVRRGIFPLEKETDALYVMACSYHRLAGGAALQQLGLVPAQFRRGLGASLGAYWSGARSCLTDSSGLFAQPDFLDSPRLIDYLAALDAGFTAPASDRVRAGLLLFPGGARDHDDWLALVERAVSLELAQQARRIHTAGAARDLTA